MSESPDKLSGFAPKRVDESWKDAVRKEKEAVGAKPRAPEPETGFLTFLSTLAMQCLMTLGEIPHPASGKAETDLAQAKYLIDVIQMLSEKTKGNLSKQETDELNTLLYELRMKFVSKNQGTPA